MLAEVLAGAVAVEYTDATWEIVEWGPGVLRWVATDGLVCDVVTETCDPFAALEVELVQASMPIGAWCRSNDGGRGPGELCWTGAHPAYEEGVYEACP